MTNKTIRSFEDIEYWKKARILNKLVYLNTDSISFSNDYDLSRQIRRASVSISSNIAKASAGKVRSQLYLALDLGYISEEKFNELKNNTLEVSKMISGFIKYLKK